MKVIEMVLVVIVLAIFDIIFTLWHISNGAVELNPFMEFCLAQGEIFFVGFKVIFTLGLCGFLMLCCTNDTRFRMVKTGLSIVILTYVTLCLYHLYLFLYPTLEIVRGNGLWCFVEWVKISMDIMMILRNSQFHLV